MTVVEEAWSPRWLVEAWGLRAFGALTTPWKLATGRRAISDDESQAAWYVEHTEGFERAKEVLIWRYQRCQELHEFPLREPGESLVRALLRRSWGNLLGRPQYQVAREIHDEFMELLADRVNREPFQPIRPEAEADADDLAADQNARYPVVSLR
jgi:hypothetical protein